MVQEPQSSLQRVSKLDWWLWSWDTQVPCLTWDFSNAGLNKENLFCIDNYKEDLLTHPLTEHCVPWRVLSPLANCPEDWFSTQVSTRDADSGYPPGEHDSQDALSYCDTPNTARRVWERAVFCVFLHELLAVLGSMWHTHLLLAVPFPQALPCCSYFMTEPRTTQSKKQVCDKALTSLTCLPQSYQVLQFTLTV